MAWMKKIILGIATVTIVGLLWLGYSIFRFDGLFLPNYAFGLSDPYSYYQRHIGSRLEQYGHKYNVAAPDTSQWKTYQDLGTGFEFKYPEEFTAENYSRDNYREGVRFSHKEQRENVACSVDVEFKGWKLGKYGLPSKRRKIDFDVRNNQDNELWFIRDQYGGFIGVESTRFDHDSGKEGIKFTGVTFIQKDRGTFLHLVDHGNTCVESTIKGIFATFRFIE